MSGRVRGPTPVSTAGGISELWATPTGGAMRETWVGSLGRENALEEGMAIHSSILGLLQTEAQRGLACDHRIAHGTGGSPLRFPKREAWLSHNSTEQRAPVTCQPASQEPTAAAGRQQLQRGLSLLMFLSVLLPAEPTWHQKPTVTACWPEGRLCGGPRGPWSQCLRAFSVSSRRPLK